MIKPVDKLTHDSGVLDALIREERRRSKERADVVDYGEIAEGLFKSYGGKPVDTGFYDKLRDEAYKPLDDAKEDRKKLVEDHVRQRTLERQTAQETFDKERFDYGKKKDSDKRKYDANRDLIKDDQWEKEFNKKSKASGFPYDMKVDPFGRPLIFDRRNGELSTGKKAQGIIDTVNSGTGSETPKADNTTPLQPKPGETKTEFGHRVKAKYEDKKPKPPTETQAKALSQAHRMEDAESKFAKHGYVSQKSLEALNAQSAQDNLWDTNIGQMLEATTLVRRDKDSDILPENEQIALAAQRQWAEAFVRSTSGAVIGQNELTDEEVGEKSAAAMKIFFPQLGDKVAVTKEKALMRKNALESVKLKSGKSFDEIMTEVTAGKVKDPNGKVRVSNGTETRLIDKSDLEAATQDGYKEVQ